MAFADNLQSLPAVTHLAALELLDNAGTTVARIENKPGQAGSLAVYAALLSKHGELNAAAANEGLALYAEHTVDANAHPGKHPNIDRLIHIVANNGVLKGRLIPA